MTPAVSGAARPRVLPRQAVAARDGVELCTDVYLPVTAEACPAVLVRTPYGRSRPFLMQLGRRLSDHGFSFVAQDCRGRFGSSGSYDVDLEEQDTYDTLAWLGEQEWSSGSVALLGISLPCLFNFRVAALTPPEGIDIRALVSLMGVIDGHSLFYRGGALVLHWALPWVTVMGAAHDARRAGLLGGRSGWFQLPWNEIFRGRPLSRLAAATRGSEELWHRWVDWPVPGPTWEPVSALEHLEQVEIPTLFVGGWNDFLLGQTLRGFHTLADRRGTAGHRLVVGDWDHQSFFHSFRAAEPGETAHLDLLALVCGWLSRFLVPGGGADRPEVRASGEPPVLCQVLGAGRWIGSDRFPPAGARTEQWYLTSGGGARTAHGDGRLVCEEPSGGGQDSFDYDPEDPVPSIGGALWQFEPAGLRPGPADQSEVEERSDVLVYTSEPLRDELIVVGPVTVTLWVSSSVQDTDFTAKLVDVDPFGCPRIVQDGIQRTRYRHGLEREVPLEPQRPHRLTVDLDAIAYRFAAGHRLRLEVSSSNFPRFDRHPNTTGRVDLATSSVVAHQTVFHGGDTPSHLALSVLDGEQFERLALHSVVPADGGND